jgi:DNA end-binding protein Ku
MFFDDEIVHESDIPAGADGVTIPPRELALAAELVEKMTVPFDPARYTDETTAKLRALIEEKIAKHETVAPERVEVGEREVVNIMDALRRSVEKAARERASRARKKSG